MHASRAYFYIYHLCKDDAKKANIRWYVLGSDNSRITTYGCRGWCVRRSQMPARTADTGGDTGQPSGQYGSSTHSTAVCLTTSSTSLAMRLYYPAHITSLGSHTPRVRQDLR